MPRPSKRRREEDEDDEDEPSRAQARAESESDDEAGRESDSEGDERSDDSSGESDEEEEGLFVACQEGSLDDLKAMEEAGALEVNRRDREEGDTPISVACRWGHLPVAEWLHSRGAALDSPNGAGEAPIHEAAIHGSPELIAWLLSALGPAAASEIERRAEGGLTPLGFACLRGNTEVAKALLEAGASAAAVDERGHTLLHLAASNGRNETAAVALEAMEAVQAREAGGGGGGGGGGEGGGGGGGDDEAEAERLVDVRDGLGRTPLMLAAGEGRLEAVEWLVGRGASVDSADDGGVRPLHYASAYGDAATALWLIEHGAAVGEASDAGNLPLHHAAQAGAVALAERLLRGDGGAGGAGARNGDGDTPMLLACFGGHVELCELLAARGEPVDSVNGDGCSGLVQACAAGHLPLVQWLLPRAPGLLEMADGRGATPLVYACEQGHAEIAEWLLEQGAAPGDEAAQAAAEAGLADLAKKLKAAKAAAAAAGGE